MANVVEINRVEDLEALRLTWHALLAQTDGASFFHTLDWLQANWRCDGEKQRLRVLLVTANNGPIGILPLTVVRERTRLGRVRVLTYPLQDWGSFFGPIGPNPTATLSLAMQYLHRTHRDWDMLDLRWVNRDERDRLRSLWAMERAGFTVRESVWKTTALVDLSGGWDDYWASRESKFRNNVGRCMRRLNELGEVDHVRYRPAGQLANDDDPRWDLYDACVEIAEESWQGSSTTGTTLSHAQVRAFLRETHALAAKSGMLDLNLLTVDEKPVAFSYNYHCQGEVLGLRTGYASAMGKWGVGTVLLATVLDRINFNPLYVYCLP